MSTPVRMVHTVAHQLHVTWFWGERDMCGRVGLGHTGGIDLDRVDGAEAPAIPDGLLDTPIPADLTCHHCGTVYDGSKAWAAGRWNPRWSTESGVLEPGSMRWIDHELHASCSTKGGCGGRHLHITLPNLAEWDVQSRARNCTRPDEPHECWVMSGDPEADPPTVTAGKDGNTCSAGAGSILAGDYHGFLRNGELT
jgi:hypothetical protein